MSHCTAKGVRHLLLVLCVLWVWTGLLKGFKDKARTVASLANYPQEGREHAGQNSDPDWGERKPNAYSVSDLLLDSWYDLVRQHEIEVEEGFLLVYCEKWDLLYATVALNLL